MTDQQIRIDLKESAKLLEKKLTEVENINTRIADRSLEIFIDMLAATLAQNAIKAATAQSIAVPGPVLHMPPQR